ncbi:MAG: lipoprotein [Alcanivoracaceae bacterium]|nr:lipoprotein [Alcanivoracaceae bacterium]
MRLLTFILLTLWLSACGQSGALYFAEPDKPVKPAEQQDQEKQDAEPPLTDLTTGP